MTGRSPSETIVMISRDLPSIAKEMLSQEGFDVKAWSEERPMTREEFESASLQANAIICVLSDKIDRDFLTRCRHLEMISQFAAGFDNVDVMAATELGIPVGFTPNATSNATADIAFGLMIAVSRKMFSQHKSIAAGNWKHFRPNSHLGFELKNKTLGVFGLGRIGMEMARRCKGAYHMPVLYCNRSPNPEAERELGAVRVSFDKLLAQSDVVSVHCALTRETTGLFDRKAFSKMKPSAIFINTARGLIHNEEDLLEALNKGLIWGAGLDVTNPEPMRQDHPLLNMENVAILPHIGSATVEARGEMARLAAENIIQFYRTGNIPHLVNPEVRLK